MKRLSRTTKFNTCRYWPSFASNRTSSFRINSMWNRQWHCKTRRSTSNGVWRFGSFPPASLIMRLFSYRNNVIVSTVKVQSSFDGNGKRETFERTIETRFSFFWAFHVRAIYAVDGIVGCAASKIRRRTSQLNVQHDFWSEPRQAARRRRPMRTRPASDVCAVASSVCWRHRLSNVFNHRRARAPTRHLVAVGAIPVPSGAAGRFGLCATPEHDFTPPTDVQLVS